MIIGKYHEFGHYPPGGANIAIVRTKSGNGKAPRVTGGEAFPTNIGILKKEQ